MSLVLPTFSGFVQPAGGGAFSNTYSVDFDGTDDYMDCGSVTQINSVTNLSTSSWFKIDAYQSGGGPIILGGQSVSGSNGFYLQALDASTIRFAHQDYGAYDNFTGISVPLNTWHHVVTVQSGTSLTIYLNGTSVGTATVTAVDSGWGSNFTIGKWSAGNFNYMNGHIDEVALFTSALSASDVTSIYNSGVPGDLSSLSPVGWWRMGDNDGGTGTTITDQGSGGNDGTLTNGPIFSTDVPPSTNTYSVDFDGTDDYLVIPDDPEFSMGDGLGNDNAFSISSWFKADSIGNFYMATKDAANREWSFRTFSSQLHFFAFGTGGGYIGRKYATNLSAGQWYHAVVTYDASKASSGIKLYLNGSRVDDGDYASGTYTAAVNTTTSIRVGSLEVNNTFADGKVDELAIFDSELSASDVTAIYNNGVPTDLASFFPVGWWRMGDNDGGTGTTITDQGSGGNNGTLTNGPTYSTDVPS